MPSKYKSLSEAGSAVKQSLKELELANYQLYQALKRHHKALADLAEFHKIEPEEAQILGGPGGGK